MKVSDKKKDNPGSTIPGRVVDLEVAMSAVKTDLTWIKVFVAPTFLVTFVSLLILAASQLGGG
ncbi:unnamed protein product [marine sediment metagenome]|uniref:Uncharacterized protein n=1 Tax=marine sediment metagenome TaxID=412755 RepID=X1IWB7_9ZZZZ